MKRLIALLYGVVCYAVFFAAFLYLTGFLSNLLVPRSVDVGPEATVAVALVINLVLIALFGIQHTVMARPGFKQAWTKIVPKSVERSTYVLISSLLLVLLYWAWRPIDSVIWQLDAAWAQNLMWAVFFGGFLLVLLSTFVIDHFDLFGLRQVWLNFRQTTYTNSGFEERDLVKFLGEDYVRYQEKVPMLIPKLGKGHATVKSGGQALPH